MERLDRHEGLANAICDVVTAFGGEAPKVAEAWGIAGWWKIHVKPEAALPPALAIDEAPGPSLARLTTKAEPTPAWDEFLTRLDAPDTFLAWLWLLTLPKATRQVLWIQGDGLDGKTEVGAAIVEALGAAATTCTDDFIEHSARWVGDAIYGRRLILVDDTKMRQVLRRGLIHRMTGQSPMKCEPKGTPGFDFRPNAAVLCTSNYEPEINRERSNMSRLLPIHVRGKGQMADHDWPGRLVAELPALMARAREAYGRLAVRPGRAELRLEPPVAASLNVAAAADDRVFGDLLDAAGLELGDGSLAGNELAGRLRLHPKSTEWKDLKEWLASKGVQSRHTRRGWMWDGIRLLSQAADDPPRKPEIGPN
jgi:hypothetical protein